MAWEENANYSRSDPNLGSAPAPAPAAAAAAAPAAAAAAAAAKEYGLVTRAQLLDLGVSPGIIAYRLRSGRLIRAYEGVYWLGYVRIEPVAQAAAAVLAGGKHAVLSNLSAAASWGMVSRWPKVPEITITEGDRRPAGVWAHRSRTLSGADIRHHRGIPTTTPERTVLDIAPRLAPAPLTRALQDARLAGYLHHHALAATLARTPRHPGTRLIRPLLEIFTANPTRSTLEDDFLPWARRHGFPEPQVNIRVADIIVDVLFPAERVIVELDGWEFHGGRTSFENDRERDAATSALGFLTYRLTRTRFDTQGELEAERLHAVLQLRGTTIAAEAQVASARGRSSAAMPTSSG
jgi:hypothetical protein